MTDVGEQSLDFRLGFEECQRRCFNRVAKIEFELRAERARTVKLVVALRTLRQTVVAQSQMDRIDKAIAEYEASK